MDWASLIASGDIAGVLIGGVLILITGGVGAAIVNAVTTSRRGIKGDALVKEQNGIEGLGKLTDAQGVYIATLEKRMTKMEIEFNLTAASLRATVETMGNKLEAEMMYSNQLIATLSANTIPIPPRPKA